MIAINVGTLDIFTKAYNLVIELKSWNPMVYKLYKVNDQQIQSHNQLFLHNEQDCYKQNISIAILIQVHQINISIQYFQGSLLFTAL